MNNTIIRCSNRINPFIRQTFRFPNTTNMFTINSTNNPFKISVNICLFVEILNNFEHHLLQNDLYL